MEDRLIQWRDLEQAAIAAESELAQAGQGLDTPEFRDLVLRAKHLREEADRKLSVILRSIRGEIPHDVKNSAADAA